MPASVPTAIVHGSDLQLSVGPAADLTACFFNGDITFDDQRGAVNDYRNYANVISGRVASDPRKMIKVPVIFKADTGIFGVAQAGAGINRASVPILTSGTGRNYPVATNDPGYFVLGNFSDSVSLGKHRSGTLDLELLFFTTTDAVAGAA